MKKLCTILLVLAVLLSFGLFALGSSSDSDADTNTGNNTDVGSVEKQEEAKNALGKYTVDIQSCRLAKDFEGKDVVIVKYLFANVSNDTPTAFYIAMDDQVYQNGVGLNEAFILDDSANYSSDNSTKEIKKGASIEVEIAYELNDTTTDIEVEVRETFSFTDDVASKIFTLQ